MLANVQGLTVIIKQPDPTYSVALALRAGLRMAAPIPHRQGRSMRCASHPRAQRAARRGR